LGVVGDAVASAFAEAGVTVRGYDRYLDIGRPEDLAQCQVVFVCVPTPAGDGGAFDLREVHAAVDELARHVHPGTIVAVKSTVPPGTSDQLAALHPELAFAAVPEFLQSARPKEMFVNPDRVVIGARAHQVAQVVSALMKRVAPSAPVVLLTPTQAELAKLCSNAMLAAKVSLANELAEICQRFDVAWLDVQDAVGLDHRIGRAHLTVTPERGFSGHCLPKDVEGLIAAARAAGFDPPVLEEIVAFNRRIRTEAAAVRT
jgi:UDPglucose 6-dehydrogenase